jgi:hypothetical protein
MLIKAISTGFGLDEGSYLRDSWNFFDFFIVSTSLFNMIMKNSNFDAFKVILLLHLIIILLGVKDV